MSVINPSILNDIAIEARAELYSAEAKHGLNLDGSDHESYAILQEEVEELWDEIKLGSRGSDTAKRKEAIQVAAMAMRFVYLMDIQHRGAVESESAHSPAPQPPASRRSSESAGLLNQAQAGHWDYNKAAPLRRTAPDLCQADRETVHHMPAPGDEGPVDRYVDRLRQRSQSGHKVDPQLRHLEQLQSLVPQEEEGQGK